MTQVDHIKVEKDTGFSASRPWKADIVWKDGKVWTSWCYGFKTKKALMRHIEAVNPNALVIC